MRFAPAAALLLAMSTAGAAAAPPTGAALEAAIAANPLLAPWTGPYGGVPPFDKVKPELFAPAFEIAIAEQDREIAAIANNPAPPTFDNTIAAMERAGDRLDRVQRVFGVMTQNVSTPAYEALDKEWSPRFAAVDDSIVFNKKLFARIAAVNGDAAKLTPTQARLTKRTYDYFVRSGAQLDDAAKARLTAYNQELAGLFADFSAKLLADENSWVVLATPEQLAGLPAGTVAAFKAAAEARKVPGWIVVNTRSSVDPFLTFSTDRALREKVWRAFVNRGDNGGPNDTNATIAKIVKLRADRAKLLGFPTHAAWRMQDTMAKDPANARALMMRVWPAAVAKVKEEVADMQAIADADAAAGKGPKITIAPWDYRFYAEKVRKARYDLDQAELKPYFELNNMIAASMWAAERLYGLQFKEVTGTVPVFEPRMRVWEVSDPARGGFVGLFYGDYFAGPGKRSGAWMTTYRTQSNFNGPRKVLASNNNNFTAAAPGEPVLISLDDTRTLFHEFGHALHYLNSNVDYPGLSQTPRDFVEYPSQVNEHWVLERELLDKFARNYKTGAPMPQALVDKVKKAEKFNQGFAVVEYLASAIVDMDLHSVPGGVVDPDKFEREDLARLGMPKEMVMRHRLPQFGHLFSSDAYSAGYYSYLWSETMDADTWAAFQEAGSSWDPVTAARLKAVILATGNMTDRADAYREFRGRDPDVKAYLEKRGFPTTE